MSKIEVDQVDPQSGTTLTLGTSGDTVSIPSGVTLANAGTVTGIPTSALTGTIALNQMATGTDGNIISYDASGNPVAVATGSAGQVLTSAGAGAPPTFAAAAAGGKVLQVVNMTSTVTTTTTSNSFVVTALTDTITPSATSSKILILATGNLNNTGASNWTYGTIARGGTNLGAGVGMVGVYATGDIHSAGTISYLDAPNSTSELTYDYRIKVSGGTGNFNQQTGKISLTLMEIGA